MTFFTKVIFPVVWIGGFGLGTLALWSSHGAQQPKYQFLVFWVAGTAFILWACAGLKRVRIDDRFLYISNYQNEISVPFDMIADVTEIRWISNHPVTIHFRSPTEFGTTITFMPKARFTFSSWTSHPVVAELKKLARLPADAG